MSTPFVTYDGPTEGMTILYLTDGSTGALDGDCTHDVADSITRGVAHVLLHPDRGKTIIHPAHIIGAHYRPKGA